MPYRRGYAPKKRRFAGRPTTRAPKSKRVTTRRRGKSLPSRLRVSTMRYQINRQISRALSTVSESKYSAYAGYCIEPAPKPAGTQPMTYVFRNAGSALTQPSNSMFSSMDLYNFPQGDGATERNGAYLYIKKSHLKIEIQMLPQSGIDFNQLNSTTEFRMMIVKANRKYNKLGASPLAGSSLFLTPLNEEFGFGVPGGTSTAEVFANMQQPIDKRKWLVYKDTRFTLSTPAQAYGDSTIPQQFESNTSNNRYPVKKFFTVDLPIYKKCHFPTGSNVPDNVDTQFLVIIQAVRTSYCLEAVDAPRNWRCNILGTTSASDN